MLKIINHLHLRTHKISLEEYKQRYPNTPTISENYRKELSKNAETLWKDPTYRQNVVEKLKVTRPTLSKTMREKYQDPDFYKMMEERVWHNPEVNKKISDTIKDKSKNDPEYVENQRKAKEELWKNRKEELLAKMITPERNRKISLALRGHGFSEEALEAMSLAAKKNWENPEYRKMMMDVIANSKEKRAKHDEFIEFLNESIKGEGIVFLPTSLKPQPDAVIVDFNKRKVYAVEVGRYVGTKTKKYREHKEGLYDSIVLIDTTKPKFDLLDLEKLLECPLQEVAT